MLLYSGSDLQIGYVMASCSAFHRHDCIHVSHRLKPPAEGSLALAVARILCQPASKYLDQGWIMVTAVTAVTAVIAVTIYVIPGNRSSRYIIISLDKRKKWGLNIQ